MTQCPHYADAKIAAEVEGRYVETQDRNDVSEAGESSARVEWKVADTVLVVGSDTVEVLGEGEGEYHLIGADTEVGPDDSDSPPTDHAAGAEHPLYQSPVAIETHH